MEQTQSAEKERFHTEYNEIQKYMLPPTTLNAVSLMINCILLGRSMALEEYTQRKEISHERDHKLDFQRSAGQDGGN